MSDEEWPEHVSAWTVRGWETDTHRMELWRFRDRKRASLVLIEKSGPNKSTLWPVASIQDREAANRLCSFLSTRPLTDEEWMPHRPEAGDDHA